MHEGWIVPDADKVTYVTDVEGNWNYFCNYVDLSDGLRFKEAGDQRHARTTPELILEDGWHFVFGGDSCDKGPGTLRFLEAVVRLKRQHPDRVHLLLGNRDINKMRWTSEFTQAELDRLSPESPAAIWVPAKSRVKPWVYLQGVAAKAEQVEQSAVTEEMIRRQNTPANRMRYHLKHDMGSDGEFEFRREELAHMSGRSCQDVSDDEVMASYEASVAEGGLMREYLRLADLAVLLGSTLFVHGQIIGNQFWDCGEGGQAWSVQCVPTANDGHETVEDLREWVCRLNQWGRSQVEEWIAQPLWSVPPDAETYEAWSGRGGSALIAYGTPVTRVPSVVYCRWLEENCMPKQYPPALVEYLKREGVTRVIVGHTPHGNCPTVIRHDDLYVIMGDTSYSLMKSDLAYQGDNRGNAVCEIVLKGGSCCVRGHCGGPIGSDKPVDHQVVSYWVPPGEDSDSHVGSLQPVSEGVAFGERFFVKARLPSLEGHDTRYLLCKIDGFLYTYQEEPEDKVNELFGGDGGGAPVQRNFSTRHDITSCGEHYSASPGSYNGCVIKEIFQRLDRDRDGAVTANELLMACAVPEVREALRWSFAGQSLEAVFAMLDANRDGLVTIDEFTRAVERKAS